MLECGVYLERRFLSIYGDVKTTTFPKHRQVLMAYDRKLIIHQLWLFIFQ